MTDETASLVVRGNLEEGDVHISLQSTARLLLEADGWKVESADTWSAVEILPVVGSADTEVGPPGPGAEGGGSRAYDVTAYALAATAAGAAGQWEGSVVFDPRGITLP